MFVYYNVSVLSELWLGMRHSFGGIIPGAINVLAKNIAGQEQMKKKLKVMACSSVCVKIQQVLEYTQPFTVGVPVSVGAVYVLNDEQVLT